MGKFKSKKAFSEMTHKEKKEWRKKKKTNRKTRMIATLMELNKKDLIKQIKIKYQMPKDDETLSKEEIIKNFKERKYFDFSKCRPRSLESKRRKQAERRRKD